MTAVPGEGEPLAGTAVGFIGLGLMGKPMARALARADASLVVHNRSRAVVDELVGEGMAAAASPADVARRAQIVILMLPDTPSVERVVDGEGGLLPALGAGHLVIDMSTTRPTVTRRLAALVAERGAEWLDAPVSGGQVGAEQATLAIMAGGSEQAFARARPLFQAMGRTITHVGGIGAGQIAKIANQIIVALTIGAVAEALTLARAAGVDPARVRDALAGGFADSRILELHGARMIKGDFTPGGRSETQLKDLEQALEVAHDLGLELPALTLTRDRFRQLVEAGDGGLDHSALIRLFQR